MGSFKPADSVVFWNCCGLHQHLVDGSIATLTSPMFTVQPPEIVALVETHWSGTVPHNRSITKSVRLPAIPQYCWSHRHGTNKSGGIALLYHSSVACITMTALNDQKRCC
jgi:hypothetical protein